jgi:hypothetical protein
MKSLQSFGISIKNNIVLMKQFLKSHYGITTVLAINLFFYAIIIFKVPWFISDDFLIFYKIGENLKTGIFPAINEVFQLFFRPVTYFFFVAEFLTLHNNPVAIKFITLFIHLGFLISFYFALKNILHLLNLKINNLIIAAILLLISIHPTTYNYIIWISSLNVALLNLFFALSLLYITKFLIENKNLFLIFSVIFFILAALSKQQALVLPLFVLILYFFIKKSVNPVIRKRLLYFIFVSLVFSVLLIIINVVFVSTYDFRYFIINLYKKPFVFFGGFFSVLLPLLQLEVYNFFTEHLLITAGISLVVLILAAYTILKFKKSRSFIIAFILIWIISFFPQILINNEFRNLNMQLLVFYFFILIICLNSDFKKYNYTILILLFILNTAATIQASDKSVWNNQMNFKHYDKLKEFVTEDDSRYFVLIAYTNGLNLPYDYYYFKNNNFGKDSISGLELIWLLNNNEPKDRTIHPTKYSDVSVIGDTLKIKSLDKNVSIVGNFVIYDIIKSEPNSHKGFQSMEMILPESAKGKILIYYDGEKWVRL